MNLAYLIGICVAKCFNFYNENQKYRHTGTHLSIHFCELCKGHLTHLPKIRTLKNCKALALFLTTARPIIEVRSEGKRTSQHAFGGLSS